MNFGYNFGVPRPEEAEGNGDHEGESQKSEYSIDLSKITPPTFRFGQMGQISSENVSVKTSETENVVDEVEAKDNIVNEDNNFGDKNCDNFGTTITNEDDDSFLAEPSMSAGQFDASFNFQSQTPFDDQISSPSNSADSLKSASRKTSSTVSVPTLIEEPLEQPVYLEEPAPHSVEELLKATVDGDTTALLPKSWNEEEIKATEMEEPIPEPVKELLKANADTLQESWENIDEEEIKAAEAEFLKMEEEKAEEKVVETVIEAPAVAEIDEKSEFVVVPEYEEPKVASKPEKKTKAPVKPKAKEPVVKKEPVATKKSEKPATAKKEKVVVEPVVLTEGRAKRERKPVERLSEVVIEPTKTVTEKVPAIPSGTGAKLGDIEAINQVLGRKTSADKVVIMLHKVLFNRMGEAAHRKASIRAFCGDESTNYETKLKKYTNAELKDLAHFLGLTGANEKAAIAAKISNFLIKPNKESVKFTAKGERILKKAPKKPTKPKPERSSKRINPDADKKPLGRPPKGAKTSSKSEYLTPETVDSDVESEVEREVLGELNDN